MARFGGQDVDDYIYDIIIAAACRHNQPTGLALWLAKFESGFNPRAVSYYESCCKGLYQFKNVPVSTESPNRWGGLGKGYTDEQLFDPALNAELAMSYMEQNGGIEAICMNVNPWEAGPVALAAWNADLRWNPPCPGASPSPGTSDPGTTTPPYGPQPGPAEGPPAAYPSTGASPSGTSYDDDISKMFQSLPALIKLGFANAIVLIVAGMAALIGVYLVVTAGTNEGEIIKELIPG